MAKTILIAESNEALADALEFILSCSGFSVVGRTSKISALEDLVIEMKPDLLLFDLQLMGKGKFKLAKLTPLKGQIPKMKVLALGVNKTVDGFARKIMKTGCDGYWNKRSESSELIKAVNLLFP